MRVDSSRRMHRVGLVVVRVALPCWTLLIGVLLVWYGLRLSSEEPDAGWPIVGISSALVAVSLVLLWFLNSTRSRERRKSYSMPENEHPSPGYGEDAG